MNVHRQPPPCVLVVVVASFAVGRIRLSADVVTVGQKVVIPALKFSQQESDRVLHIRKVNR